MANATKVVFFWRKTLFFGAMGLKIIYNNNNGEALARERDKYV